MFSVYDETVTVCHSQRCHVADCSKVEHQPQRKLGLRQLSTGDWWTSSWSVSDDRQTSVDCFSVVFCWWRWIIPCIMCSLKLIGTFLWVVILNYNT